MKTMTKRKKQKSIRPLTRSPSVHQNTPPVPLTYKEAIEILAQGYVEGGVNEFNDLEIYLVPDAAKKIVRFILVSDSNPATDDVWPITLRESARFPFKSSIAVATKEEWKRILNGKLEFGANWNLMSKKRVWPHD